MLRKLVATTLILSAMSVVAPAQASSTRDIGESLCAYVQSDNKSGIRKVLRQRNVKIRSIFDDLRCNGKDLLSFADHNGAEDAGAKTEIAHVPGAGRVVLLYQHDWFTVA